MMRYLTVFLLVAPLAAACGARASETAVGGEAIRAEVLPSMMGDDEVRARDLLDELTLTITSNAADPAAAELRVAAFLRVNEIDLLDVATAIEARAASLEGLEALVYQEQLSALLASSWQQYNSAVRALEQAAPEQGRNVRQLVDRVERERDTAQR